jgi:hypothetical protein
MAIHYEKHPVSAERKAELKKQGVQIVDSRFNPEGESEADKPKGKVKE